MRRLLRSLWRLRVTLALQAILVAVALATGAFDPEVGAALRERHGFGWPSLRAGRVDTLFTSALLVESAAQWARIALLLCWSIAPLEWRSGTARAALVYLVTNTASGLAVALLQGAAAALGQTAFAELVDVGASAGAYGCLGAWLGALPAGRRRPLLLVLSSYLVAKPLVFPSPAGDLCHALAALLGLALAPRQAGAGSG